MKTYSGVQIQSAHSHYASRYDGHSLSLPHGMSRALYRLKGAKGAFRPPHESSTLREPETKGCRTYPAVVILPQAATTTPSPDLPSRPRELPTTLAGTPQSLHSLPQEHSQRITVTPSRLAPAQQPDVMPCRQALGEGINRCLPLVLHTRSTPATMRRQPILALRALDCVGAS